MRSTHSVQPSTVPLPRGAFGFLVFDRLVNEGARLVGASHDAIAATDANVLVHEDDAVRALERGAGRADVDAGGVGAMLAHHRRGALRARLGIAQRDLADPLRVGFGVARAFPAVFVAAGGDAAVAIGGTLVGVDEEPPTNLRRSGLAGRARPGVFGAEGVERDAWSDEGRQGGAGALEERAAIGERPDRFGAGAHGFVSLR